MEKRQALGTSKRGHLFKSMQSRDARFALDFSEHQMYRQRDDRIWYEKFVRHSDWHCKPQEYDKKDQRIVQSRRRGGE